MPDQVLREQRDTMVGFGATQTKKIAMEKKEEKEEERTKEKERKTWDGNVTINWNFEEEEVNECEIRYAAGSCSFLC